MHCLSMANLPLKIQFQHLNRKSKLYEPHPWLVPPLASDRRSGRPDLVAAQPPRGQDIIPAPAGSPEGRRTPQPPRSLEDEQRETEDAGLANESYKRSSRASDWRKMEDAFVSGRARGVVSEARPDPPMATPLLRLRE